MEENNSKENHLNIFYKLKAKLLFHDPPHKMVVLKEGHERIGKELRDEVLSSFAKGSIGDEERLKRNADRLASSFDRLILHGVEKFHEGGYLDYYRLHNIFKPDESIELKFPDRKTMDELVQRWAEELDKAVSMAAGNPQDRKSTWLAYSTLFALYEIKWYELGLPPSLADTRFPTHTVFDHLYATASASNFFYDNNGVTDVPKGFVVSVDIPGVQSFISHSRKLGDFWAASWIISNLSWRTVWRAIKAFGPDVLISPSPRLNPYLLVSLSNEAEKLGKQDLKKKNLVDILKNSTNELMKMISPYESFSGNDLFELAEITPMIPEKIRFILPKMFYIEDKDGSVKYIEREEDVADLVKVWFREAWKEILEEAGFYSNGDKMKKALREMIKQFGEKVIEEPPFYPRIKVVNVDEVNKNLNKYLEKIGWKVEGGQSSALLSKEGEISPLLWNVLIFLLDKSPTYRLDPIPRAFWVLDDNGDSIVPVYDSDKVDVDKMKFKSWVQCSLCGEEPAIKLGKEFKNDVAKYKEEDLEKILEITGVSRSELEDLPSIIKPGEALGPYCLLRRLLYLEKREKLGFESTDRLVLRSLDLFIKEFDLREKLLQNFIKVVEDQRGREITNVQLDNDKIREALSLVFSETFSHLGKERYEGFEKAANKLGIDEEEKFINMLEDALRNLKEELKKEKFLANEEDMGKLAEMVSKHFGKDLGRLFEEYLNREENEDEENEKDVRLDRALSLFEAMLRLRRYYAILRMDGDFIGRIVSGKLPLYSEMFTDDGKMRTMKLSEYVKMLYESMKKNASGEQRVKIEEVEKKAMENAEILEKTIKIREGKHSQYKEFEGIIVSPSYYMHISTSLMLQALRDTMLIRMNEGFPIYAGGDDLNALLPIETSIKAVAELRKSFWYWNEGKDRFAILRIRGDQREESEKDYNLPLREASIPVSSLLPTGRSASLRFAKIKDLTGEEIAEAGELLENEAKESSWSLNGKRVAKDTIVMSDSSDKNISLLPFSLRKDRDIELVIDEVHVGALGRLWMLRLLGMLSGNLPEDAFDQVPSELWNPDNDKKRNALKKLGGYVFKRNISTKRKDEMVNELMRSLEDANAFTAVNSKATEGTAGDSYENLALLYHIFKSIKIMRDLPK
ncbi:MAG: type III-B CRISPR-associated protein Cas10/Cmr2 [Fervidicoccaceae archaeon]